MVKNDEKQVPQTSMADVMNDMFGDQAYPSDKEIEQRIEQRRADRAANRKSQEEQQARQKAERRREITTGAIRGALGGLVLSGAISAGALAASEGSQHLLESGKKVVEHIVDDPSMGPEQPTPAQQKRMAETLDQNHINITETQPETYHVDVTHE